MLDQTCILFQHCIMVRQHQKVKKKGVMANSQFIIKITSSVSRIFYYGSGFKDTSSIYLNLNFLMEIKNVLFQIFNNLKIFLGNKTI